MSVILLWVSSAHLSPLKCGVFFFFVSLSTSCCGVEYWKHFRVRYYRVVSGYWLSWGLFWQHRSAFCSPHMALFGLCWVRFNVKMISFLPRWDGEVFFICHFFPFAATRKGWGMSRPGSLFQNRVPSCLMTRQQTSHSCFPTFHKCTSITSFLLVSVSFNRTFQYLYKDEHSGLPSYLFSSEYTIRLCSCLNVVLSLTYRLWQADCRIPSANHSMLGNGSENINHFFFLVIC